MYYTLSGADLPVSLWTVHEVNDGSQTTTLSNLLHNSTYSLRLLAYTDIGDGPLSHVINVTTTPDNGTTTYDLRYETFVNCQ